MSKAFTKETDDDHAEPEQAEIALPKNAKNYMTPIGFNQLQLELKKLLHSERPKVVETLSWAASNGDRSENADYTYAKKRLREIDRRIRYLTRSIESAQVVDPELQKNLTQVFFGATVTYTCNKKIVTVTIVGVDEADINKGKISWMSPVAKALLRSRVGDEVEVKTPSRIEKLKVTMVKY
ncbi:MAG TPA: transcription elongation factor GreB [Gammaproteobacteria bacterium]|nr:transcription elongation factor GreB [Gammaproteobacteria bacterium]